MKFNPTMLTRLFQSHFPQGIRIAGRASRPWRAGSGFTLAEVLAALALMAIIIPVAMHGMQIAARAGILGERKAIAMRLAERVLSEQLVTGNLLQTTASGSILENGATFPWTLKSETWPEDAMNVATVRVTFTVQGNDYSVSASTLYDPTLSSSTSAMPASTPTP